MFWVIDMKKSMKKEIDKRYSEIFRKLNIDWKLELKRTQEELISKGLNTSGIGVKSFYDLIDKLVYDTIEMLDKMFDKIKEDFKSKIPLKDLKQYTQKSEENILANINEMEKEILSKVDAILVNATNELRINNIKGNAKAKLERIYDKNKNLNNYKRIKWLVVINTVATIGGFILGIISLFK